MYRQQLCYRNKTVMVKKKNITINYLVTMVTFIRDSSVIFQFCVSPLTKPEIMTNRSTSTLTEVKILLTEADSFTPKDRSPEINKVATDIRLVL